MSLDDAYELIAVISYYMHQTDVPKKATTDSISISEIPSNYLLKNLRIHLMSNGNYLCPYLQMLELMTPTPTFLKFFDNTNTIQDFF